MCEYEPVTAMRFTGMITRNIETNEVFSATPPHGCYGEEEHKKWIDIMLELKESHPDRYEYTMSWAWEDGYYSKADGKTLIIPAYSIHDLKLKTKSCRICNEEFRTAFDDAAYCETCSHGYAKPRYGYEPNMQKQL